MLPLALQVEKYKGTLNQKNNWHIETGAEPGTVTKRKKKKNSASFQRKTFYKSAFQNNMKFLKFTSFESPKELIVGCFYISTTKQLFPSKPSQIPTDSKILLSGSRCTTNPGTWKAARSGACLPICKLGMVTALPRPKKQEKCHKPLGVTVQWIPQCLEKFIMLVFFPHRMNLSTTTQILKTKSTFKWPLH